MRFEATTDTLDTTLTLPLSTGEYEIPAIPARDGLILKQKREAFEAAARRINAGEDPEAVNAEVAEKSGITGETLQEMEEMSLTKQVRDQMLEDGVTLRELEVAGMTAFLWQTVNDGGQSAERYWATGGKEQTPNRSQRRTATRTRQGAATTTRKPASQTGTKRQGGGSSKKATGGRKSSSTGTSSK